MHYRNVMPSTDSCASSASRVEQLGLDSSCAVSTGAAALPVMTSLCSSDTVDQCSRSFQTTTASGENISAAELNNSAYSVHVSCDEMIGTGNVNESQRSSKQLSPKTRIRRTQLKMLADNLSKFYAPATGGKRRELLARRRSAVDTERSARERQLEVIRKQVTLVEKRKKAELELAAATSHHDAPVEDPSCVHTADTVSADSVSKRNSRRARLKTRLNRKLHMWKTKRSKIAMRHKQKLSHATRKCDASVIAESTSF